MLRIGAEIQGNRKEVRRGEEDDNVSGSIAEIGHHGRREAGVVCICGSLFCVG